VTQTVLVWAGLRLELWLGDVALGEGVVVLGEGVVVLGEGVVVTGVRVVDVVFGV